METSNHAKNGANLKSQTSKNLCKRAVILTDFLQHEVKDFDT